MEAASFLVPSASVARPDAQHVMTIVYQTSRRETVVVRCVVSRELADKLRRKATEENSTLSDMVARLLAAAIEKE
jgi:S-adenosylmethionine synthetase